jgi:hypothetical protein
MNVQVLAQPMQTLGAKKSIVCPAPYASVVVAGFSFEFGVEWDETLLCLGWMNHFHAALRRHNIRAHDHFSKPSS